MKTKKVNKKLEFTKSTVADLNLEQMNQVKGGSAADCESFRDLCPSTNIRACSTNWRC